METFRPTVLLGSQEILRQICVLCTKSKSIREAVGEKGKTAVLLWNFHVKSADKENKTAPK